MKASEAQLFLLLADVLTEAIPYVREKIADAKAEGLITIEEQQERADKIEALKNSL